MLWFQTPILEVLLEAVPNPSPVLLVLIKDQLIRLPTALRPPPLTT